MTAWLMYQGDDPKRVGGGYDDYSASHYSWDERVPNAEKVKVGDEIVLWNGQTLLGMSVIESIEVGSGTKDLSTCPTCGKADIAERKTMTPKYRCWNQECKVEFAEPTVETVPVATYRSRYEPGWVDLRGIVSGAELRALCVMPKSQNALRELRWEDFRKRVETGKNSTPLDIIDSTREIIVGGHTKTTVRVRKGQPAFRAALLDQFGEVCAFTGPMPAFVLEAAHLYSYAANGKHHPDGGLLLRRDVHRLFDLGQIAIDPHSLTLDVSPRARAYADYDKLHGQAMTVALTNAHRKWITKHWSMHRNGADSTS
ncbi:HNH endonuclease signature motif containing protein [Streptomyces sp. SP17BM10]|uniref:HNH endonuclease n=1 Tax=Streptomyces sp. SP17BM10 TaxID=3002530 RepID=UPI002E79673B|nr:HNH endonuclease signature motif containing protein [Streptomyces sp. SP17BM10]MEE1787722.1 HNH endonuclease signature motif containing protein [Streptomyces sp. SP17BM10]